MPKRPNILLILVDDLGYGDLSSYGAPDLQTPNIDRLVANGVKFNHFYANCPVCSPTRASILTGCFPDLVGVPGVIRTHANSNFGYLSPEATMLPEVLNRAGYHTSIIGKWHLGLESPNTPTERGFDHFHGFLGDMMDDYYTHLRHGNNYMRYNQTQIDPEGHATDLFSDWAIDYIESRREKSDPFFLYLAYNAPHTPLQPPKEWLDRLQIRQPRMPQNRLHLGALIEHLDHGIGRVVAALEENLIAENTVIIFTSDNGGGLNFGASNANLRGGKGEMWEGGIKEPMCVVWPNQIRAGSTADTVALTMDLFPTICEIAEVEFEHRINGQSLLADMLNQPTTIDQDREFVWMRREGNTFGGRAFYAIRQGQWKLLQNSPFEPLQLFDLATDPLEANPLDEQHPQYRILFDRLRDHIIRSGTIPWQRQSTIV